MTERPNAKKPKPEEHQQMGIRKKKPALPILPPKEHPEAKSLAKAEYMAKLEAEKKSAVGGWNNENEETFWNMIEGKE